MLLYKSDLCKRGLRTLPKGPPVATWYCNDLNSQPSRQSPNVLTTELPPPTTRLLLAMLSCHTH